MARLNARLEALERRSGERLIAIMYKTRGSAEAGYPANIHDGRPGGRNAPLFKSSQELEHYMRAEYPGREPLVIVLQYVEREP